MESCEVFLNKGYAAGYDQGINCQDLPPEGILGISCILGVED